MRRLWATLLLASLPGPVLAAADPTGDWMVTERSAVIHIAPCASPDAASTRTAIPPSFCGAIVWTSTPPGTDQNNPDPAKRSRSVIGMPTLLDMKTGQTPNKWEGKIYNAEDGRTYSGAISLSGDDVLHVQGCVLGILCGGQDWTRALCEPAKAAPANARASASQQQRPAVIACREQKAGDPAQQR